MFEEHDGRSVVSHGGITHGSASARGGPPRTRTPNGAGAKAARAVVSVVTAMLVALATMMSPPAAFAAGNLNWAPDNTFLE